MTGSIHNSYHIRDDYYYLPKEYSSLLRDPFTEFDFVEWDVIDYYPGLGTPPASIEVEVPVSGKKRMETVYNGQGEKLSVRYFSGDTLASEIFYNGSFTYESKGGGPMKLRDMLTPEGVVVKAGNLYNYRYFMRDYLGNVRYVSGIYQYTDYDPLGKIIYSSNLDKNVYLYEGKERIPDIAEEYESVYDFGAR